MISSENLSLSGYHVHLKACLSTSQPEEHSENTLALFFSGPLFLRSHCKNVFLCLYRTPWRTARLRSRQTMLSCWRTCRMAFVRWRNRLPRLTAESHSISSYSQNLCVPLCFFVGDVFTQFHVEGKEKDVLYSLVFVASYRLTLVPLHGRWKRVCVCARVCTKERSLHPVSFRFLCVAQLLSLTIVRLMYCNS